MGSNNGFNMQRIILVTALLLASASVFAGHGESKIFQHAVPVMSELVLFTLAITAGLAGAWGIHRMKHKKDD